MNQKLFLQQDIKKNKRKKKLQKIKIFLNQDIVIHQKNNKNFLNLKDIGNLVNQVIYKKIMTEWYKVKNFNKIFLTFQIKI